MIIHPQYFHVQLGIKQTRIRASQHPTFYDKYIQNTSIFVIGFVHIGREVTKLQSNHLNMTIDINRQRQSQAFFGFVDLAQTYDHPKRYYNYTQDKINVIHFR